ncbi:MAG: hypothetical protein A2096_07185 [Spirochaetes bacterium GWF1_41_5]|nr:MAG: hypothetical protein A2096_07185 [Spirochaetes bacterium GWF1_41_5]HBE04609.1 nucleotidyltransferase domain-containing protein [Spirochaetia bacterium]
MTKDLTNEQIKDIIQNVITGCDIDRIILFGSRARGNNIEESDYDILLLLKEQVIRKEKMKIYSVIQNKPADFKIDFDILIKSVNEMDYYKDITGSVVQSV